MDWDTFWQKNHGAVNDDAFVSFAWEYNLSCWKERIQKDQPHARRILECGCGSGHFSFYMAQNGFQVSGVDLSESAISKTSEKFREAGLSADFVVGDIRKLPFPSNSFDVVFSGGVLEFFEDIKAPLEEMVRVLRPGGMLIANIVPRKFSIQTIADVQRTIVHALRNIAKGKIKKIFKSASHTPSGYGISDRTLSEYASVMNSLDVSRVEALCASPFPQLALPNSWRKTYANFVRKRLDFWRKFNENSAKWTEIIGITYNLVAYKKEANKP